MILTTIVGRQLPPNLDEAYAKRVRRHLKVECVDGKIVVSYNGPAIDRTSYGPHELWDMSR